MNETRGQWWEWHAKQPGVVSGDYLLELFRLDREQRQRAAAKEQRRMVGRTGKKGGDEARQPEGKTRLQRAIPLAAADAG